jgi:SAM-dependent methyltransferase
MRWEILKIFKSYIEPLDAKIDTVAIVGGWVEEPELIHLARKEVTFFGIDNGSLDNFNYLNLNVLSKFEKQFDLVVCSQVLEHVYDVKIALENLVNLVKPDGYLWVACPASNYAHGSPDYFSAGYSPQLITQLLESNSIEIIFAENYGSPRMYFFTHGIQYWPTRKEYEFPLFLKPSRYFFQQLFWRICAYTKSPKFNSNLHSATETIVFARKSSFAIAP